MFKQATDATLARSLFKLLVGHRLSPSFVRNMGTLHAGGMGVLCGLLHAVGPDHIATLASRI